MLTFMNSKLRNKLVVLTSKTQFKKKKKFYKIYSTDLCIGEDLEFIIHVFHWCTLLDHELYTKC